MASKIFDLPEPFKPVIALNFGSQAGMTVRVAYDLKPSRMISSMYILSGLLAPSALALAASPGVLPPEAFKNITPLASLRPYDKNVDCRFIVVAPPVDVKSPKEGGTVYTILVADDSGSMLATFWDEQGAAMKAGDVILMRSGLVTLFKGHLRLACKQGTLHRIDRFKMTFKETPNVSDMIWIPNPSNPNELIPSRDKIPDSLQQ